MNEELMTEEMEDKLLRLLNQKKEAEEGIERFKELCIKNQTSYFSDKVSIEIKKGFKRSVFDKERASKVIDEELLSQCYKTSTTKDSVRIKLVD